MPRAPCKSTGAAQPHTPDDVLARQATGALDHTRPPARALGPKDGVEHGARRRGSRTVRRGVPTAQPHTPDDALARHATGGPRPASLRLGIPGPGAPGNGKPTAVPPVRPSASARIHLPLARLLALRSLSPCCPSAVLPVRSGPRTPPVRHGTSLAPSPWASTSPPRVLLAPQLGPHRTSCLPERCLAGSEVLDRGLNLCAGQGLASGLHRRTDAVYTGEPTRLHSRTDAVTEANRRGCRGEPTRRTGRPSCKATHHRQAKATPARTDSPPACSLSAPCLPLALQANFLTSRSVWASRPPATERRPRRPCSRSAWRGRHPKSSPRAPGRHERFEKRNTSAIGAERGGLAKK
jgi:hypothetical protein